MPANTINRLAETLGRAGNALGSARHGEGVWQDMLPSIIASAAAASDLGYPGVGEIILEWQLSPHAIARMFALSAAHDLGMACATILMAGSVARYNVCREGWDGEPECMLATHMLEKHATRSDGLAAAGKFRIANSEAVRLVRAHWAEITAEGPFRQAQGLGAML